MSEPQAFPAHRAASAADRPVPEQARVCVAIATRGRPAVLAAVVDNLRHQTLKPMSILVACTSASDVGDLAERSDVQVHIGPPGLARQRNALLRQLPDNADVVVFFDDDFVPHRDWLAAVSRAFALRHDVACITGQVVADGILGPGIGFEQALAMVETHRPEAAEGALEACTPYGCNMAYRVSAVRHLLFDERLVLYGWLEDVDFGGALVRAGGRVVKSRAAWGVHMGVKQGRVSGHRLGYSQVMNPVYLKRKGTMTTKHLVDRLFRNLVANMARSLAPEPFIDRRGRLWGNAIALLDLFRGRITPERAEML